MKISSIIAASVFALAMVGLVACGGNKSAQNAANSAASAAGNAANTMASAAGNAGNAMASAAGNAAGSMGSMANSAMEKMPNCGAVKPVWVNLNTKVYHEPGDPFYGKTKHGEYLCPSQAKAQGFHAPGVNDKH
jgi:hypothetical protein